MVTEAANCTSCGHPVLSGARFCQHCGADVSQEQGMVPTAPLVTPLAGLQQISALDLLKQETLGEYEILAELGRGGMATVYLAHDIALGRRVAIKVMSPALVEEGVAERFRREARTAASLNHPHIIPIYAVRERPNLLYFVMKFIQGQSLDPILKGTGSLPIPMARLVLAQAAGALGYAHRRGVIHRDVKPANIMLDEEGWVVVTDFGIAKVSTATGLTMTGVTVGTPAYMSPEQCMGREVTGASDQYSLGVVAYQLITGQKPFTATSAMAMMYAHFNETPRPLRELRPDCPPELDEAVLRMLAKEPEDRWPTIDEPFGSLYLTPDDATRNSLASLAISSSNATMVAQLSTPTSPVPPARRSQGRTTESVPPGAPPDPSTPRRLQRSGAAAPERTPRDTPVLVPQVDPLPTISAPASAPAAPGQGRRLWAGLALVAAVLLALVLFRRPGAAPKATEGVDAPASRAADSASLVATPGPEPSPPGGHAPAARPDSTAAPAAGPAGPAVSRVGLTPARAVLLVGRTLRPRLDLRAADGSAIRDLRQVSWTSSAPGVALVDSTGTIRAVAPGKATIAAQVEGRLAQLQLEVSGPGTPAPAAAAVAVASVSVTPGSASLAVGGTLQLAATPRDGKGAPLTDRPVSWSVNGSAVSVSPTGQVSALAPGTASVLAQAGGQSGSATITVLPAAVAELRLTPATDSLRPGQTVQLTASARDARGAVLERRPTWESSDSAVATVSGGLVTGRRPGSARITATVEERSAAAQVVVLAPPADPAAERARAAQEIGRTLDAFVQALNARNVAQLRQAYPGMSAAEENRWRSMLEEKTLVKLTASLEPAGDPRIDPESAESRFRLLLQLTYAGRPVSNGAVDYRAVFQREAGKWQLTRLQQQ